MRRFNLKAVTLFMTLFSSLQGYAAEGVRLEVTVKNIHSDQGTLIALLYASKAGFPVDLERAQKTIKAEARHPEVKLSFEGVEPGEYAVSIIHDENNNGKLDTNFIGMPREGVGVSRDAKGSFGPPGFQDAKIKIDSNTSIEIHLKYL